MEEISCTSIFTQVYTQASHTSLFSTGNLFLYVSVMVEPSSWQQSTRQPLAHLPPLLPPQWDGEEKWTKHKTCGLR